MGIIAIRHGQSEISYQIDEMGLNNRPTTWNVIKELAKVRNIETEDSGLSIKGNKQIKEISESLKKYRIDDVYVSPTKRAKESFEILQTECNLTRCTEDERLNVIISGILHGHINEDSEKYFNLLPQEAINIKQLTYSYQTGETQFRAVQRIYNFLDDIKEEWENKNILLITHKSTLRIINTYFNEMLNEDIYKFNPKNSEVILYGKIFE